MRSPNGPFRKRIGRNLVRHWSVDRSLAMRALIRTGPCTVWLTGAWLMCGASTDPVRNGFPGRTINPIDTTHPIYYPVPTETCAMTSSATVSATPEELLREFFERHTKMDYAAAAEAAMRLAAAAPDQPEGHYNLACALARLQRSSEAIGALDKAIDCGWRELLHTTLDPDLQNVRNTQDFQRIITRLKSTIEAERVSTAPLRQDDWRNVADELTRQAPALLARYHVPGASIALVRDAEVVWTGAFGVRDRRNNEPLLSTDCFGVCAPVHALALIAAQQLHDHGALDLFALLQHGVEIGGGEIAYRDAPREWPVRPGADSPRMERRTARQGAAVTIGMDTRSFSSATTPRKQESGRSVASTSNTMYGLLRLSVEAASGQSFSDYCQEHILTPLHLSSTAFAKPGGGGDSRGMATGHSALGTPMQANAQSDEYARNGQGPVIYTNADDLARLILLALRPSAEKSAGASPDCVNNFSATLDLLRQIDESIGRPGVGLAIQTRRTADGSRLQLADTPLGAGTGCLMRWYPEARCGVVVLYNSATGTEAAARIAHIALGGD